MVAHQKKPILNNLWRLEWYVPTNKKEGLNLSEVGNREIYSKDRKERDRRRIYRYYTFNQENYHRVVRTSERKKER